jgi:hypothetical protein
VDAQAAQTTQDAEHLRLLSIFHYVVAAMMGAFSSFPIIHFVVGLAMVTGSFGAAKPGAANPEFVGWFFVLFAGGWIIVGWTLTVCIVIAGRCLAQRRRHLFCLIMAGVMAATCMPFGTVLGVFTIIVLLRPSVKQAFGLAP